MIPQRNLKKGRGRPSEGPYICPDCGTLFPLKVPFVRHQAKECTMRPPRLLQKKGPKIKQSSNDFSNDLATTEEVPITVSPSINLSPEVSVWQRPTLSTNIISILEKKYPCDTCHRSYVNHRDLLRHKRYLCGQEPLFECRFCYRKFYHRYLLSRHEFNFHQVG